jgi:pimeloyl-ACP methyl ester carboxylesterase
VPLRLSHCRFLAVFIRRIKQAIAFLRPIRYAKRVRCPVLLVMAKRDEVIPPWSVKKEHARLSNAQLVELNSGHFDP